MDSAKDPGSDKKALRNVLRGRRRSLSGAIRSAAERAIVENLLSLLEFSAHSGRIALSIATDGEVDVTDAAGPLRERGWEIYLPVTGGDRDMWFVRWDPTDRLVAGGFGIMEPSLQTPRRTVDELDVVVLPCVGLSPAGDRLGFGQGFYDRALARHGSRTTLIAVGFDIQLVDQIRPEGTDVAMDVVLTESRTIDLRRSGTVAQREPGHVDGGSDGAPAR